jgi:hypothetical protein
MWFVPCDGLVAYAAPKLGLSAAGLTCLPVDGIKFLLPLLCSWRLFLCRILV